MNVQAINIEALVPDQKDIDRADNLSMNGNHWFGNGAPFQGKALTMAKLIKDPEKLARRAKAICARWGVHPYSGFSNAGKTEHPSHVWKVFTDRMREMGFTWDQIEMVRKTCRTEKIVA